MEMVNKLDDRQCVEAQVKLSDLIAQLKTLLKKKNPTFQDELLRFGLKGQIDEALASINEYVDSLMEGI